MSACLKYQRSTSHKARHYLRKTSAALIAAMLLAACQTDGGGSLSLDEAKKVTADFGGRSFTPPPRTVTDVTAILSKQARDDLEWVEEARKKVDAQPAADASPRKLAVFYYDRGIAASKLGRAGQAIADYRLTLKNARKGRNMETVEIANWLLGLTDIFAGSFSQAIADWEQAIRMAIKLDWDEDLVFNYAVLADLYSKAGDPEGVKKAAETSKLKQVIALRGEDFSALGGRYRNAELKLSKAMREASLLEVAGRFKEAEPLHRKAIEASRSMLKYEEPTHGRDDLGDQIFDPLMLNWQHANLADNLRRQGRLVEAEVWARRALTAALSLNGRYSAHTAYMLGRLTRVVFEQGRFADAEALARANIEAYEQSGASSDSVFFARARITLADTLVARGRHEEALGLYERAREALAGDPYALKKFVGGSVGWAFALLESGRADEAMTMLDEADDRLRPIFGPDHYNIAEVQGFRATALAAKGNKEQALEAFSAAMPVLLDRSRGGEDEGATARTKGQRLRVVLEAYVGLLADIERSDLEKQAGIDAAAEAFRIADAARLQSVQTAISASGARAAARDPDLADLTRREQDAQHQIGARFALLADMLSRPTSEQSPDAVESLRTEIGQLSGARAALLKEIGARFPEYAELIQPKPATVEQARAVLLPGEALIATYVGPKRTYVWAVPRQGEVAFAAAQLGAKELSDTVALLRSALEPNAETLGDIPDFDVAEAYGLYRSMLGPVEAGWKDADSLLVVAHGPLGYLPLSLLPTKPPELAPEGEPLFANHRNVAWLARSHAVTMLPSVASLRTLRSLPPGPAGRKAYVGFGDPFFSAEQAAEARLPADETVETAALASSGLETRGLKVRLRAAPRTGGLDSAELARLPRLPDTADETRSTALALRADLMQDVFLGLKATEELAPQKNPRVEADIGWIVGGLAAVGSMIRYASCVWELPDADHVSSLPAGPALASAAGLAGVGSPGSPRSPRQRRG